MALSAIFNILLITLYLAPFSTMMPSVMQATELKLLQSCFDKGYCVEKHDLYPQDIVNRLLQQWIITVNTENNTEAEGVDRRDTVDGFAQKFLTLPKRDSFDNDCATNVVRGTIFEIVDRNNKTRVVVQSRSHIEQLIDIEECTNAGRISTPSLHFDKDAVMRYHLQCVQQTLNYKFLVLNLNWTGFEMVESKNGIPVACCCMFLGFA